MITVNIQQERFDSGELLNALCSIGGGAVSSFTGVARPDEGENGAVTAIELEHFPGMTQAVISALADEAMARWGLHGCTIVHRIGHINVGEEIVFVGAVSDHRAAAIDACSYLIDRLKTDAPFWKKETRAGGHSEWVEPKISDDQAAAKWQSDAKAPITE
jgi:molybdopterin synthase catalytic subunit